jgi:glycine/D-amino acid oxidase-like deaminating enzyme
VDGSQLIPLVLGISMNRRVIVVGGSAAGLMAARQAASLGAEVLLFEKKGRLGRKLRLTGKGRCNPTNKTPLSEFIRAQRRRFSSRSQLRPVSLRCSANTAQALDAVECATDQSCTHTQEIESQRHGDRAGAWYTDRNEQ